MLIEISKLQNGKANPRRIFDSDIDSMCESVICFPKMLKVRGIVTDPQYNILCGHVRYLALKKLMSMSDEDIDGIRLKRGRSDDESLELIRKFRQSGKVECIVADLPEEKEKELMYKDNHEYGEFDFTKLASVYSENDLVFFGIDESEFYDPSKDDKVVSKVEGSKPKRIDILTFGKFSVEVSNDEYERLVERFESYVETNTVSYGFIRNVLDNFDANNLKQQ